MWISKQLAHDEKEPIATSAKVTLTQDNSICTSGSAEKRYVPIYAPFGIESVPPLGSQVVLIENENGTACLGVLCNSQGIDDGELKLFSKGGAYIVLKNNGEIILNGARITKDGKFIATGV